VKKVLNFYSFLQLKAFRWNSREGGEGGISAVFPPLISISFLKLKIKFF
jgi:hypothetical protein